MYSKFFNIGDVYDRVANWCKHDEHFVMERASLLAVGKMTVITHFSLANSSLRKWYHKTIPASLVGGNCTKSGSIDLSAIDLYDVTAVSYGMDTFYGKPRNMAEFINNQYATSHESKSMARWWWWMPGDDLLLTHQGDDIVAANLEKTLNVHCVVYPDLSMFNETDVTQNVKKIGLPDYVVPFTVMAWAMAAYRELRLEVPDSVYSAADDVVAKVSDKLTADELALVQLRRENPTD